MDPKGSSSSVMSWALIDLFQPRLIVPSKIFQVSFLHLVYHSALFLSSCCSSFLLHVIAYFICISIVVHQLVLLSALPKLLHSSCGLKILHMSNSKCDINCSQDLQCLFSGLSFGSGSSTFIINLIVYGLFLKVQLI